MLLVVRGSFTPPVVRKEDVTRHGPVHHVGGAHHWAYAWRASA